MPIGSGDLVNRWTLIVLAIAILFAGLTTLFIIVQRVFRYHSELPVWDHWIVFLTLVTYQGHVPFNYLWSQHNEHRIFIPKLFYFTDVFLFSGRAVFLLWSTMLLQLVSSAIFVAICLRDSFPRVLVIAVSGLSLAFLFSPVQIENFAWSFQICFILMGLFSTLSVFFLAVHREQTGSSGRNSSARLWLFGCIAAATGATLTLANGLVLWPLLLAACWLFRLPRSSFFSILIVGALEIAAYMWGYRTPGHHSKPLETITRPDLIVAYLSAYVGGPWSSFGFNASIAAGAVGLIVSGVALWSAVRRRTAISGVQVFCVCVISFEILTGFVTSLGRIKFGIAQASASRYQLFAMLLWLALGLFFLDRARQTRLPYVSQLTLVLSALFCLPGLIHFQLLLRPFDWQSQHLHDAELALIAGVDDREALQYAHPDRAQMAPAYLYMKRNKLSVFSHASLTSRFPGPIAAANYAQHCEGSVLRTQYIANLVEPGFKLEGWGWNNGAGKPLSDLFIVNEQGIVIGFGHGGLRTASAGDTPARFLGKAIAWTAYARSSLSDAPPHMSVIAADGSKMCQIGATIQPPGRKGYEGVTNAAVRDLSQARIGVFRNGQWWMDVNGDGLWEMPADRVITFGQAGDLPVVGNWGNGGTLQIGVFRKGQWLLDVNGDGLWQAGVDKLFTFGQEGDLPIVGDWDNTGKLRIGVFRAGQWWVDMDGDGRWQEKTDKVFTFGQAGDIPVVGDWDGTGWLRIGVFRGGRWLVDLNGNNQLDNGIDPIFGFGEPGDNPVVGSWDGPGKLRIGIFRKGAWWLDLNGNNQWDGEGSDTKFGLGQPGDIPVVGIWANTNATHTK